MRFFAYQFYNLYLCVTTQNCISFCPEFVRSCPGRKLSRPQQHRPLKRKDSIRFLVFLTFSSIQAGRKNFSASAVPVRLFIQKQLFCFQICLMLPIQPFLLSLPPEALHWGVVPVVSLTAHATDESVLLCQCLIIHGAVLASPIRVQDTTISSLCMANGIFKR